MTRSYQPAATPPPSYPPSHSALAGYSERRWHRSRDPCGQGELPGVCGWTVATRGPGPWHTRWRRAGRRGRLRGSWLGWARFALPKVNEGSYELVVNFRCGTLQTMWIGTWELSFLSNGEGCNEEPRRIRLSWTCPARWCIIIGTRRGMCLSRQ